MVAGSLKQGPRKGNQRLTGGKAVRDWKAGGDLLLEEVDPPAASKFQAGSGVDNAFLTVALRKQEVGTGDEGLIFTGQSLNFGLQFDY